MPYIQQPYDNSSSIGSILDIMGRGAQARANAIRQSGETQARALTASGQAYGQMGNNLADIIAGTTKQVVQQVGPEGQALAAQRQALADERNQHIADAKAKQGRQTAVDQVLKTSQTTDPQTGMVTYDRAKLNNGLVSIGLPPEEQKAYLGLLDASDAAVSKARGAQTDALKSIAELVDRTGNDSTVFTNEVQRAITNGIISERMAAPYLDAVSRDPKHVAAVTSALLGKKPELMAVNPGDAVIDKGNPGAGAVFTAPPKPIAVAPGASLVDPSKPQDGALYTAPKEPTKPASAQEYEYAKSQGYQGTYEQYQNEDANRKRPVVNVGAGGPNGALDPDGLEYAATEYRVTGKMPALGMGNGAARAAIVNAAAKQTKDLKLTPAIALQKQYAMKADSKSLDTITRLGTTAEAAEQKALGQIDIITELSDKVNRTTWPIINAAILAGKTEIAGDPDATKLMNAISTFGNEYGKIIEGSTGSVSGSSDSARSAANKLVAAKMNGKQLAGVLDLMKREMGLTIQGYDVTRAKITERMGGTVPPPQTGPADDVIYAKDPQGNVHSAKAGTALPAGWAQVQKPGGKS